MQFDFKRIKSNEVKDRDPNYSGVKGDSMIWEPVKVEKKGAMEKSLTSRQKPVELLWDEWYDCAFCKGTGEKPRGSICSVCRGKKKNHFTPPVVKCAYCKGKGEERPRTNITCTPCRGKGYIAVTEQVERCNSCRGTGKTSGSKLPCVTCKGSGVITKRKL